MNPQITEAQNAAVDEALLEFRDVTKVYGEGEAAVHALAGATFRIDEGEFVAIMGHSGSGKSTTMNILGCLDSPTSGSYLFRGVDMGALTRKQSARLRRYFLGFVFQGLICLPEPLRLRMSSCR